MTNDIFSLENIDDVSAKCRKSLPGKRSGLLDTQILKLFELKNMLTIGEVIVALYRVYKRETTRMTIYSQLHKLTREGRLIKVGRGRYCLHKVELKITKIEESKKNNFEGMIVIDDPHNIENIIKPPIKHEFSKNFALFMKTFGAKNIKSLQKSNHKVIVADPPNPDERKVEL